VDNSPSVLIGRVPFLTRVLERLALINEHQAEVARNAHAYDIRRGKATRLPFKDSTVDVVYSSHMLEHLDREDAVAFLAECRRVLKPGGWLRIAVPDLEQLIHAYLKDADADHLVASLRLAVPLPRGFRRAAEAFLVGHRGHRWMYDVRSLTRLVQGGGFASVQVLGAGQTMIPDVGELDLREREAESLYVEAQHPRATHSTRQMT
jgi:SAM-dependent methyltransferase